MPDIDYPPTRTIAFGDAPTAAVDELEDVDETAIADGVAWLVETFGADATVTLSALTAGERAKLTDTIQRDRVGNAGNGLLENWVVAACVDDAPWLADGAALADTAESVGDLPPQVVDWLSAELDDLNDLTGNG